MYVVLCYDVVSDKRRGRLFKKLKGFLRPVQKSVFEGPVLRGRYGELVTMVAATIDHQTDTVRIYELCRGCVGLVELLGTSLPLVDGDEDTIV